MVSNETMIKNLMDVKEIFDSARVKFWLDFGTALSVVRNGMLFEWDDIDLGITVDEWEKLLASFPELEKKGFRIVLEDFEVYKEWREKAISLYRFGRSIDVATYYVKGQYAIHPMLRPVSLMSKGLEILYYIIKFDKAGVIQRFKPIITVFSRCVKVLPAKSRKPLYGIVYQIFQKSHGKILVVFPKHHIEKLDTLKFNGVRFNIPSDVENFLKFHYGEDWRIPKREWNFFEDGSVRILTKRVKNEFLEAMR